MAILRTRNNAPISETIELRFVERKPEGLILAWIDAKTDVAVETLLVPERAYDQIAANAADWDPLREELTAGPFVDMQRLMI